MAYYYLTFGHSLNSYSGFKDAAKCTNKDCEKMYDMKRKNIHKCQKY